MEITSMKSFLAYYERIREVTNQVVAVIPPDQLDFSYMPGKFTIGDLLRHMAAIERNLFAEVVLGHGSKYNGCGKELGETYTEIVAYFEEMHRQSVEIISSLTDEDLKRKITFPEGRETEIGAFLRALIIHEVHHRGALCIYLNLLQIKTPPMLGLTEEQVKQQYKEA